MSAERRSLLVNKGYGYLSIINGSCNQAYNSDLLLAERVVFPFVGVIVGILAFPIESLKVGLNNGRVADVVEYVLYYVSVYNELYVVTVAAIEYGVGRRHREYRFCVLVNNRKSRRTRQHLKADACGEIGYELVTELINDGQLIQALDSNGCVKVTRNFGGLEHYNRFLGKCHVLAYQFNEIKREALGKSKESVALVKALNGGGLAEVCYYLVNERNSLVN